MPKFGKLSNKYLRMYIYKHYGSSKSNMNKNCLSKNIYKHCIAEKGINWCQRKGGRERVHTVVTLTTSNLAVMACASPPSQSLSANSALCLSFSCTGHLVRKHSFFPLRSVNVNLSTGAEYPSLAHATSHTLSRALSLGGFFCLLNSHYL